MVNKIQIVKRVLWINFLTSIIYGTVIFMIPVYAEELGASYIDLGRVGAIGNLLYTISTLVSGFLLDQLNKSKFFLISNIVGALSVLSFALTDGVNELIIIRGIFGIVSAAFWVSVSTLIMWHSTPDAITTTIGLYNLSWITAFIFGPVIGGILSNKIGFDLLFILLSLSGFFISFLVIISVEPHTSIVYSETRLFIDTSALRKNIVAYMSIIPYSIILGVYMAILPGFLKKIGFTNLVIGILLTVTNGFRGIGFLKIKDFLKFGTRKSMITSSIMLSISLVMIIFVKASILIVVPLSVLGFAGGMITPILQNYIARRAPKGSLGFAMGAHEAIYGLGLFTGPLLGGLIAELLESSSLFATMAITSLLILPFSIKMEE